MKQSKRLTRRAIVALGITYLILLLVAVASTSYKYWEYYTPPALDHRSGEDEVLRFWNANYETRYDNYKKFMGIVSLGLGIYLTVWAAAVGVLEKSTIKGLLALVAGGFVTVLALSVLPWVYFPFDKYPVAALWVIGASPWIALSWLVLTVLGRIVRQRSGDSLNVA